MFSECSKCVDIIVCYCGCDWQEKWDSLYGLDRGGGEFEPWLEVRRQKYWFSFW